MDTLTLLREYQTDYLAIMAKITFTNNIISNLQGCPGSRDTIANLTTHVEGLHRRIDDLEQGFIEKLNIMTLQKNNKIEAKGLWHDYFRHGDLPSTDEKTMKEKK